MSMHGWPLVYRHHAFWRWWAVAQGAVGSDCVGVVPPAFDQDLRFMQRVFSAARRDLLADVATARALGLHVAKYSAKLI
jgi:hypothetical protein